MVSTLSREKKRDEQSDNACVNQSPKAAAQDADPGVNFAFDNRILLRVTQALDAQTNRSDAGHDAQYRNQRKQSQIISGERIRVLIRNQTAGRIAFDPARFADRTEGIMEGIGGADSGRDGSGDCKISPLQKLKPPLQSTLKASKVLWVADSSLIPHPSLLWWSHENPRHQTA